MKTVWKITAILSSLCLLMSTAALASESAPADAAEPQVTAAEPQADAAQASDAGAPIVYTDGENTITIQPDYTFQMTKTGENMEGNPFTLTVTGTADEEGKVTITGLFDGEIDLFQMASEEQLAGDQATAEEMFAAAMASVEEDDAGKLAAPGTYTDGTSTMVIDEENTFVMTTPGQNMDGEAFELTVTGTISEEGELAITGVFDGEFELTELASEDQLKENLETAQALYAIAVEESAADEAGEEGLPGIYSVGGTVLTIADDLTFEMLTPGENMDGNEFTLTIRGNVDEEGNFEITGIFDGDLDLTQLASEEQVAQNLETLQAVFAAGHAE